MTTEKHPVVPFFQQTFSNRSSDDIFTPALTFFRPLLFCLIEFLKTPNNRELFRCCSKCGKFFVASRNNKNFKKCSECSRKSSMSPEERREYQKNYNKKRKQEKESKKLEARIANLMKQLEVTRMEALEIIKADSML